MSRHRTADQTSVHLTLFGQPGARIDAAEIHCASKKAFALFAFLALERRPHSRRTLATLFWGARDADAARASLRATLFRLPAPMARCLAIGRESIAISDVAALTSDVGQFEALAGDADAVRLREAAALYRGHLLTDFDPDATPEFDDWLVAERTRLKHRAYDVFDRVVGAHVRPSSGGTTDAKASQEIARGLTRQWLVLDPAAERAHRWLMRIHLDAGHTEAAQAQYEMCQRTLAVAEGRAPSAETSALLSAHRAPTDVRPGSGESPSIAPAVPSTSFVGRIDEVAAIVRLLAEPACRMITLHGLGGVGKTRLAHAVMQQVASNYANGATWVGLESVEQPAAVPDAIARALGLELEARTSPREALLQQLRSQRRLIVIDNFEHLLAGEASDASDPVDLLLALLQVAPQLRLVITSRETLGVQEEWVYEIEGLAYRTPDHGGDAGPTPPAVELFAQRARQA